MCQSSSFVCLFVSCWLDTGFTLSKCTANRLLFMGCRLFLCVSYWQEASITFSKCTVNVLVFFFCLFVCELSTGHKHHLYSGSFVCLFVSCQLDTSITLAKGTVSCLSKCTVSYFSNCTVNLLVVFFCLFVCEMSAGHKHPFVKACSQLFIKVYSQLFLKLYSQSASRLLLSVCLWVVSWTQASLWQSVQSAVYQSVQSAVSQSVQSIC